MKKRVVVIGAGLCGSLLSALLRNRFHVTVVEQGRTRRPLYADVDCDEGEVNSSINRAQGLGGTTNYWHNALIELTEADLWKAGIPPGSLIPYYAKAWALFLSQDELRACNRVRDANRDNVEKGGCTVAHMVLPRTRANVWHLANRRHPGDDKPARFAKCRAACRKIGFSAVGRLRQHVGTLHFSIPLARKNRECDGNPAADQNVAPAL